MRNGRVWWQVNIGIALWGMARFAHAGGVCPIEVVDDRVVHVTSAAAAAGIRTNLYQYIWGQPTLPDDADVTVVDNVPSPIGCNVDLARVDELHTSETNAAGDETLLGEAWHFVPAAPNGRLVIVHNGHLDSSQMQDDCEFQFSGGEDGLSYYGMQMTINALVGEGFDVLAVAMPLYVPGQCTAGHDELFTPEWTPATGSPIRYFLDTTLRSVNHLVAQQPWHDISMTGLSGGGWTTTLYAALDPRISLSVPVAGSLPLYLRNGTLIGGLARALYDGRPGEEPATQPCDELGDTEQHITDLYSIAGYPDLYALGGFGPGRRQVQVLNRRDACCFGQAEHADPAAWDSDIRGYEKNVRTALHALGSGTFELDIDEASITHQVSRNAVHDVLLGALDGAHAGFAAASSGSVVRRGFDGNLWHYGPHGWSDTGFAIAGTPAVLAGALHPIDVVVRDPTDAPQHLWFDGSAWHEEPLPVVEALGTPLPQGKLVGDAVMLPGGTGGFDAVALAPHDVVVAGTDFWHWRVEAAGTTLEKAGDGTYAVGPPALSADAQGALSLHYRAGDTYWADPAPIPPTQTECVEQPHVLYRTRQANGAWQPAARLGGEVDGFPTAIGEGDATDVFFVGSDAAFWQLVDSGGSTEWMALGAPDTVAGSPSTPVPLGGGFALAIRDTEEGLGVWTWDGAWQIAGIPLGTDSGALPSGSPVSIDGATLWQGGDGELCRWDGSAVEVLDVDFSDGFDGTP